jgi:spore germination protein YaaH
VELARQDGYQGFNIDFEGLNYWDEQGLTDFVQSLSQQLMPLNKTVTIAVIPRTASDPYNKAYNYRALAPYVSRIVLMTYDAHSIGTPAGAVAPISWVKAAIQYAVARVNPSKVVLGIAAYGYNWSSSGNTVEVHDGQAVQIAGKFGVPILWNAQEDEAHFSYTANGHTHQVYFENGYSDAFKLQLVNQYHLGGVAIWRLGDEDQHLWTALDTMEFSH